MNTILINGRIKKTHKDIVTYEDIVEWAGFNGHPTVIYQGAFENKRDGSLWAGRVVIVKDNTRFSVAHTTNA